MSPGGWLRGRLPSSLLPSRSISPGNIWTPLWEELAALTPDPAATVREGALAQVGGGHIHVAWGRPGVWWSGGAPLDLLSPSLSSPWAGWASHLMWGLQLCSWPPKPTSARGLSCL